MSTWMVLGLLITLLGACLASALFIFLILERKDDL